MTNTARIYRAAIADLEEQIENKISADPNADVSLERTRIAHYREWLAAQAA